MRLFCISTGADGIKVLGIGGPGLQHGPVPVGGDDVSGQREPGTGAQVGCEPDETLNVRDTHVLKGATARTGEALPNTQPGAGNGNGFRCIERNLSACPGEPPPAYRSDPERASAATERSIPELKVDHSLLFHLAMWLASLPPAVFLHAVPGMQIRVLMFAFSA